MAVVKAAYNGARPLYATDEACAGLLTLDEAMELSARTGRPIFAVAGSAT